MTRKNLPQFEQQAIEAYRSAAGRNWKRSLCEDRARASSRIVDGDTYSILHALVNRIGPSGVDKL